MIENLKTDNSTVVLATVKLLEFLSKNTSPDFHKHMAKKNHAPIFLQTLRRVRKKLTLKFLIDSKETKERWSKSD